MCDGFITINGRIFLLPVLQKGNRKVPDKKNDHDFRGHFFFLEIKYLLVQAYRRAVIGLVALFHKVVGIQFENEYRRKFGKLGKVQF